MLNKNIQHYSSIKIKILKAIEKLAQPVINTLTPRGTNVLCEDENGEIFITNDGVTIAANIQVKDKIENAIIKMLKFSAIKTNSEVGDGTTTSILLSRAFIKEGFKLLDNGWNPMVLKKELEKAGELIQKQIKKMAYRIKGEKDLRFIASVACNNDKEITENTVKAIRATKKEGTIILEPNPKDETEVKIEEGFLMESGMFSSQLSNIPGKFKAEYKDVPILVTDKRIYSPEEAIGILEPVANKGIKDIIIVAEDFIDRAANTFITNHLQKRMNILLVKDTEKCLEDLANYLGIDIVSEKRGKLTTQIEFGDFGRALRIVSIPKRTLIVGEDNPKRQERIKALREEIKLAKEEIEKKNIEKKIGRMTSGTVTIYVGGKTAPELKEKRYRYEDAISATRSANEDGYVVGGGLTLYNAFKEIKKDLTNSDIISLMKKVCSSPLEQIAINCNLHLPTLLSKVNDGEGYNALNEKYENLLSAGIIDPSMVVDKSFKNALSVSNAILSSRFLITNIINEDKKHDKQNSQT